MAVYAADLLYSQHVHVYWIWTNERSTWSHSCNTFSAITWEIIVLCGPSVCPSVCLSVCLRVSLCVCVISSSRPKPPTSRYHGCRRSVSDIFSCKPSTFIHIHHSAYNTLSMRPPRPSRRKGSYCAVHIVCLSVRLVRAPKAPSGIKLTRIIWNRFKVNRYNYIMVTKSLLIYLYLTL